MFTPNRDLFRSDQVPEHFKELFIISGYRSPGCTIKQCVLSVFKATNETLNFWTHFLPAVYFWHMTYRMSQELNFVGDHFTWPLVAYMVGVCIFPITSAVAHLFNTLSDRARHICFFFDYAALSIFTMGASIAYKAYVFPHAFVNGTFYKMFLPVAVLNAVLSLVMCCQTRFMENSPKKKILRISAFAIPYCFDSLPVVYRILLCEGAERQAPALVPHTAQFLFAALSAIMYITHIPERYFPGRFDIVGHSHQLFHVFTIISCYLQMSGLTRDMIDRRQELIHLNTIPSPVTSLALMTTVLIIDAFVLAAFIKRICHVTPRDPAWRHLYGDQSPQQVHGKLHNCCDERSKSLEHRNEHEGEEIMHASGDHLKIN